MQDCTFLREKKENLGIKTHTALKTIFERSGCSRREFIKKHPSFDTQMTIFCQGKRPMNHLQALEMELSYLKFGIYAQEVRPDIFEKYPFIRNLLK